MSSPPSDPTDDVLDPDLLLRAYAMGVFPMSMEDGEIGWFSPDPRGIIPLDDRFHIPHGLKRALRKEPFEVRFNSDFEGTMRGCADRPETWISEKIVTSYTRLFDVGHAHSVEAWQEGELMGGLYGVAIGGAFFGESMFSRATDASKIALVHLVQRLRERGFAILDTQWTTAHLETFGAFEMDRDEYLERLTRAITLDVTFG